MNSLHDKYMTLCWGVKYLADHMEDDSSMDGARWLYAVSEDVLAELEEAKDGNEMMPYVHVLTTAYRNIPGERSTNKLRTNLKKIECAVKALPYGSSDEVQELTTVEKVEPKQPVRRGHPPGVYLIKDEHYQEHIDIICQTIESLFDEEENEFILDGVPVKGFRLACHLYNIGVERGWTTELRTMGSFFVLLRKNLTSELGRKALRRMDESNAGKLLSDWKDFYKGLNGAETLDAVSLEKFARSGKIKEQLIKEKSIRSCVIKHMIDKGLIHPIIPFNSIPEK
ncbi:MAG: hypothetical protein MJZ73_11980 [Bacteroidaceae bacterium]|nr:hypothetical protein [Bacteroidaceae bacterium]